MQRKALVVGVSQYNKVRSLESFANNANAIADILEPTFKVKRFPEAVAGDRVRVGKGGAPCDRLQTEIRDLFTATDLDTVLFYFAGHGVRGKQVYPKTYLATSESEVFDDGYRKSIEIDLLKQLLRDCPAREQIVWLDCCYGGDLADFREICDRNDGKTRFIITASRSQDPAYQEIAGEMGIFTRVLVEALARTGTTARRITCAAIEDAVREGLQSLQYPQMPQFYRTPNQVIYLWQREQIASLETQGIDGAVERRITKLKKEREKLLETLPRQQNFEDILEEVRIIEVQIESLQKEKLLTRFRILWNKKLSEIDFNDAKDLICNIKKNHLSKREQRYAILLLDNTIAMEGELMVEWLENYLKISGTDFDHYTYEFKSIPKKEEFILDLANKYSANANLDEIIVKLSEKLSTKGCFIGGYFLIKIKIPQNDNLLEFLSWFVKVFWQEFIQILNGNCAVVATICINKEFQDDYLSEIFCGSEIDGQKIKRLPLQNWTIDDAFYWLRDHSGLGEIGCDPARFDEIANSSIKIQPFDTKMALFQNLNRLLAETT